MAHLSEQELRDLAPAYAMGTLSLPERVPFEAALAEYQWLRDEVSAHRAVLDTLATSEHLAPPPALKARTMARIAERASHAAEHAQVAPVNSGSVSRDQLRTEPTRDRRRWVLPAGLAAALAASMMVALGQSSARARAEAALRVSEERLSALGRELVEVRERAASTSDLLAAMLDPQGDLTVVKLTATGAQVPGVQFYWNRTARRGVLRVAGLEPAPTGKIYQLWLIQGGMPVPMPVFNTEANGTATIADVRMPADPRSVQAIAITLEPAGGSQAPSTAPFLVGALASD